MPTLTPKRKILNEAFVEFIAALQGISTNRNYELYFRGHSSTVDTILPRIYRGKPYNIRSKTTPKKIIKSGLELLIDNEDQIFREIILRSPQDFIGEISAIEKLVKMQHYSLPTRLLDITTSPLVALYFACSDNKTNGEVVIFKVPKKEVKFFDGDAVSMLANISKMPSDFTLPSGQDKERLDKETFNVTFPMTTLLHEIRNEKVQFAPVMKQDDFNRVLPVKVKLNNNRIIRQNGAFFLFGINEEKTVPAEINPNWIHNKIKIKASDKNDIKKDLSSLGISESTLFPEMEYQSKKVIEMYGYRQVNKV